MSWPGRPVGVVGLFLTGGLSLIVGTYFRFVSRRLEERPEDNPRPRSPTAPARSASSRPGSYWPIMMAGCAALVGHRLAFFYVWLIVIAGIMLLIAIGGLVFEYHIKPAHH